jgi:16S rRNA C967 or C1407 C5-methylase (RsmB/RsmF family)/NOL1/NOP2/fmu family ribosome biogenesis protein
MQQQLQAEFDPFIAALDTPAPTSVRINPRKISAKFGSEEHVPWTKYGYYLQNRPSFTLDPLFHAGTYYVQEASSMFIEEIWNQINPGDIKLRVLDMCAAPGGKSTHLLSLMNTESLLVCNEVIPTRNKTLQQNTIKWGYPNVIITQNKTTDIAALKNYFDVILVDAPCSGEGLFRKDKDAVNEWSTKNVDMCVVRQKEILEHAANCLKPGGYIIYSTCTYETAENDENVAWLAQFGIHKVNLNTTEKYPGIYATESGYQFYPHRIKGEGFYIALLQKEGYFTGSDKGQMNKGSNPQANVVDMYLQNPDSFTGYVHDGHVYAIPQTISSDFAWLRRQLYIRNAGIFAGTIKGKDFLPSHDLALSICIKPDVKSVDLTEQQAIAYLRCETIRPGTMHRGWNVVKYNGHNLGWVKVLEGRVNNYFPKEWRILM